MATITRNEVASMLGVSVATVRRMEGKSLHPKLIDGVWRFEIDEVKSVQYKTKAVVRRGPSEGEIAAEVFRRLDEGQSLRQIVRECQLPPMLVRALHQEWAAPLGEADADNQDVQGVAWRDEDEIARWEAAMQETTAAEDGLAWRERMQRRARIGSYQERTGINAEVRLVDRG